MTRTLEHAPPRVWPHWPLPRCRRAQPTSAAYLSAAYLQRGEALRVLQAGVWLSQLGGAAPEARLAGALVAWRGGERGGALSIGQVLSAHLAADVSGALGLRCSAM